jgi:hypothetical protein
MSNIDPMRPTQTTLYIADSVNRGISTAKGMRATYTIELSINEDLKLRKRKRRDIQSLIM